MRRIDQLHHPFLLFQIGHAANRLALLVRKLRRRFDGGLWNLQHLGHLIDNEAGAHSGDQKHHDPLTVRALHLLKAQPQAKIDHRQHGAAQVDDALDEGRRLGNTDQFFRHPHNLLHAGDRHAELLLVQTEHHHLFVVVQVVVQPLAASVLVSCSLSFTVFNASLMAEWSNRLRAVMMDTSRLPSSSRQISVISARSPSRASIVRHGVHLGLGDPQHLADRIHHHADRDAVQASARRCGFSRPGRCPAGRTCGAG